MWLCGSGRVVLLRMSVSICLCVFVCNVCHEDTFEASEEMPRLPGADAQERARPHGPAALAVRWVQPDREYQERRQTASRPVGRVPGLAARGRAPTQAHQPPRAPRGTHAPRLRMALHYALCQTRPGPDPQTTRPGRQDAAGNEPTCQPALGTGIDWNEFHTATRYPNSTD